MMIKNLLQHITVLVADDAPMNLMIMTQVLVNAGATVLTAVNGIQVLEKLEEQQVDIILMDLQMPELNGFEAANIIRQSGQRHSQIPIIAVTAETEAAEIEKSRQVGMNDFITKPFVAQIIYEKIISTLQTATLAVQEVSQKMSIENLQDFDLTYLKEITDGQPDQMKLIIENLVLNGPLLANESLKAVKLERWADAFAHLHKLKGLVGLFYMGKIKILLIETEEAVKKELPNIASISENIEFVLLQLQINTQLIVNEYNFYF